MVDLTNKISSLQRAVAMAIVQVSGLQTMEAIQEGKVPKGDVFEFSRAAGLLAIKRTGEAIPGGADLLVEHAAIRFQLEELTIKIEVEVAAVSRAGVELQAMHGAAVAALTVYDMLAALDRSVEVTAIRLLQTKGGPEDYSDQSTAPLRCAVVVCSDSVSGGSKQDAAGKAVMQKLSGHGLLTSLYVIIPDEKEIIRSKAIQLREEGYHLALFTGGTGLSSRDVTPEAIEPLLDRTIPGIMEAARNYGQQRTPYAMLSRGIAGFTGNMLILTLPGSTRGAAESMDALFPYILHIFRVAKGMRHGEGA